MNLYRITKQQVTLYKVACCLDISYRISRHLAGENHTQTHQRLAGFGIMFIGSLLVEIFGIMIHEGLLLLTFIHTIGGAIHGIGLIPFATNIERNANKTVKP